MAKKKYTRKWTRPWPEGLKVRTFSFHHLAAAASLLPSVCAVHKTAFPVRLETIRSLHRVWNQRLHALKASGLQQAQHPFDFAYLLNCPSVVFCDNSGKKRPCSKSLFCPWCSALQAALRYDHLLCAFNRLKTDCTVWRGAINRYCTWTNIKPLIDDLKGLIHQTQETKEFTGLAFRATIQPILPQDDRFFLRLAWLAVTRKETSGVPLFSKYVKVTDAGRGEKAHLTRLAYSAALLHQYPANLLDCDPDLAVSLIQDVDLSSLNKTVGVLRLPVEVRRESLVDVRGQTPALTITASDFMQMGSEELNLCTRLDEKVFDHPHYLGRLIAERAGLTLQTGWHVDRLKGLPIPVRWAGTLPCEPLASVLADGSPIQRLMREFPNHASIVRTPRIYVVALPGSACREGGCDRILSLASFLALLENPNQGLPTEAPGASPADAPSADNNHPDAEK